MMWILKILVRNLMLTVLLEVPVGYALGARKSKKVITMILANVITNPLVGYFRLCLILFFSNMESAGILVLEFLAFISEGFMFSKFDTIDKRNPYLVSLILNLISFSIGEIIALIL